MESAKSEFVNCRWGPGAANCANEHTWRQSSIVITTLLSTPCGQRKKKELCSNKLYNVNSPSPPPSKDIPRKTRGRGRSVRDMKFRARRNVLAHTPRRYSRNTVFNSRRSRFTSRLVLCDRNCVSSAKNDSESQLHLVARLLCHRRLHVARYNFFDVNSIFFSYRKVRKIRTIHCMEKIIWMIN